jgi:thiosulfate reductase cytochrome b subunit
MADDSDNGERVRRTRTIYRHRLPVRIMHWVNFLCVSLLLLSGLQIFNAHPALYWGEASDFEDPLLEMGARPTGAGVRGITTVFGHEFDTTGFLGVSRHDGVPEDRAFPAWLTVPGPRWLAMGRRWHFFFAWLFVINGLAYVTWSLYTRHATRNLLPTRRDWRSTGKSIVDHALLRRPKGEDAERYNVLQKLAYLGVVFVLGPLAILMGLAMSPHMNTVLGWLLDLVGGRQSARTLHFLVALAFVLFFLIHVFEVLVTGAVNNLRSMITGRYRVDHPEGGDDA